MAARFEEVLGGTEVDDILRKYFTTDLRPGYARVFPKGLRPKISGKGFLLPERFVEFEQKIREMEIRPDDVWVATYPKSGTTWAQEMVWCICNDLDLERAKSVSIRARFPFVEISSLSSHDEPGKETNKPQDEYLKDSVKFISNLNSPRFIKTHLPWDLLPEQLKSKKCKIVYVARNPKDACVSYFHHCCLLEGYTGSFVNFVNLFLEDSVPFSPYWDHLISYWEHKDHPNILYLTYEEMKKDLPLVISKVCKFMGKKQPSEDEINTLCQHLSFDSMKSNSAVNYEFIVEKKRTSSDQHFMRKGKVDCWKEEMGAEDIERFDAWIEKNLRGLNSEAEASFRKWFKTGTL